MDFDSLVQAHGSREVSDARKWRFRSRRSQVEFISPLWLYPELNCSSCVDDVYDQSGETQLAYYVEYLERLYPSRMTDDAVPIYWSVRGDGIFEHGPNERGENSSRSLRRPWTRRRVSRSIGIGCR